MNKPFNIDPRAPTPEELGRLPSHKSAADMKMMADAIRMLSGKDRLFFAIRMLELGLMRLVGDNEEEQALLDLASKSGMLGMIGANLFAVDQSMLDEFIEGTAEHCEAGKCEDDETAAGGWNASEVTCVYANLYVARRGLTIPFGANVQ